MVLTEDIHLPTDEELNHREIPLTHNYFLSSAMWLGKYCDDKCKEFMLCRNEELDPRKCIKESNDVTDCGFEFFRKVKKTCPDELEWYTTCIEMSGRDPRYHSCRDAQVIFDTCMSDNGFERAKFGHFQMIRVHETTRPRPKPHVPIFEDAVPSNNVNRPEVKEAKPKGGLGMRHMWEVWSD